MSVIVKGDSPFDAFIVSGIKGCHTEHIKFYNISFNCKTIEDADGRVFTRREERKTGEWIERNPQNSDKCRLIECSECGDAYIVDFGIDYEDWIEGRNFCRRCGADLRGEADDR